MSILKSTNSGAKGRLTQETFLKLSYEHCGDMLIKRFDDKKLVFYTDPNDSTSFLTYFYYENLNNLVIEVKMRPITLQELTTIENIFIRQFIKNKEIDSTLFKNFIFCSFRHSTGKLKKS